jgi:hypothetical protein
MCPGCQAAADQALVDTMGLSADHDPAVCRDLAIQPYGCPCQHNKGVKLHGKQAGLAGAGARTP